MICFLNEIQQREMLLRIPRALQSRKLAEIEAGWKQFGVRLLSSDPATVSITADISGATRDGAIQFLQSAGAVAVTVEPRDVRVLLGGARNDTAAAVLNALKMPQVAAEFQQIPVEDLFTTLHSLAWDTGVSNPSRAAIEEQRTIAALENPDGDIDLLAAPPNPLHVIGSTPITEGDWAETAPKDVFTEAELQELL